MRVHDGPRARVAAPALLVLEELARALVDDQEAAPAALEPRPAAHVLVRVRVRVRVRARVRVRVRARARY